MCVTVFIKLRCLTWSRTGTNNKVLQMFGTTFENFHAAAGSLMNKIRSALPEGSTKCRIRTSAREMHQPATGSLLDTLGEGDNCVYHDA